MRIQGVYPALCTPINEDETVNEKSLRRLLDYELQGGVHGIFVLSSTGEFFGLRDDEKRRALRITVDHVHGRVPVMAGAFGISTKEAVRMAEMAQEEGADCISVLTPVLITPNDEEIYRHYRSIAASTDLPVTLYNNPARTHVNISAAVAERLAQISNIVAIKDSSGDLGLMMSYIHATRGMEFDVLSGRDLLIFANLMHGGSGTVAATANVAPRLVVDLYEQFRAGNYQKALADQYRLLPYRSSFGMASWPAITKDALNLMGFQVGNPIAPIEGCAEDKKDKLRELLRGLGVLD